MNRTKIEAFKTQLSTAMRDAMNDVRSSGQGPVPDIFVYVEIGGSLFPASVVSKNGNIVITPKGTLKENFSMYL